MVRAFSTARGAKTAVVLLATLLCGAAFVQRAAASAPSAPGVGWELTTGSLPTNFAPGGKGLIYINVFDVGEDSSNGTVTVTDVLPPGVTATEAGRLSYLSVAHDSWDCTGVRVVTCTNDPAKMPSLTGGGGGPDDNGPLFDPSVAIAVDISPQASGTLVNHVTIAGGGASTPASTTAPINVNSTPAGFGIANWDVWFSNANGTIDTQAGSHPYLATFSLQFNSGGSLAENDVGVAGGEARNLEVKLPPGFVGDATAVPQCTREQFDSNSCPSGSEIGIDSIRLTAGIGFRAPVFNLTPPPNVPASFAFDIVGIPTFLDTYVRTGSDYGLSTRIDDIPQREVLSSVVTFWGVPGDPSHDKWRSANYGGCLEGTPCAPSSGGFLAPLLTLPTACTAQQQISIHANTWESESLTGEATSFVHDSDDAPTLFTGCERLPFSPTLHVAPDTTKADTPAGLSVEISPPAGGLVEPNGLSSSDIQNTKVVLPQGVAINPGQAAGLQACQLYQDAVGTEAQPSCPSGSKVGTVEIATPLLPDKIQGSIYVLQSNPPHLQLLLAASADGVNLKLIGNVELNEATGQLTTTFDGTPALPFTNFKLAFSGGAQAALVTPPTCGTYSANADFTAWSSPFLADVLPDSSFTIESGSGGSPCASPLPFQPTMIAGSTTDQAGGYTDFTMLLQRADDQQRLQSLQFKVPEGLLGMISQVPLCGEPQASQGNCPAASQIGHTVVQAGPGPYPLTVPEPGQPPAPIYLTGPYQGAPYGLSIAVPVVAGPFNLGAVVVRARIEVDPHTAQLTITTGELPHILDGIPADLRTIDAVIDRPGFMFNPTGCEPMSFSGTAYSTEGASAALSSHFQMGSCQALKFQPNFKVSASGKTSKADGASFTAKIVYPTGNLGDNQASSQSNIAWVKVELPKKLPSRLTTLQKACLAHVFETDPANCPPASVVGHATALTPVLPVPLTGPAYFVSHGGEAFPSLIVVLQGYGVTVDLVGATFISKAGITSSTFKSVPDVPIGSFELNLPAGPYSALAANGNLCKANMVVPTEFIGHNGAVIHQATKVSVTGCPKAKKAAKKKRKTRSKTTTKGRAPAKGKHSRGGRGSHG